MFPIKNKICVKSMCMIVHMTNMYLHHTFKCGNARQFRNIVDNKYMSLSILQD